MEPRYNFGEALAYAKEGYRIQRSGWNGKHMFVFLYHPTVDFARPFLVMSTVNQDWVPWLASQTDILAEDWRVLGDGEQQQYD